MNFTSDFQPREIVCLEHEGVCLYAEVIQVVVSRQLCWVRPLLLGGKTCSFSSNQSLLLTDLRFEADLLWPLTLFRPALDTEVIPLLTTLLVSLPQEGDPAARQQLNSFVHQVWQAYKSVFDSGDQA